MIVISEERVFQPVTIVLESQYEVDLIAELLSLVCEVANNNVSGFEEINQLSSNISDYTVINECRSKIIFK